MNKTSYNYSIQLKAYTKFVYYQKSIYKIHKGFYIRVD